MTPWAGRILCAIDPQDCVCVCVDVGERPLVLFSTSTRRASKFRTDALYPPFSNWNVWLMLDGPEVSQGIIDNMLCDLRHGQDGDEG